MAEDRVTRKLAAILAADVVGYSRLMGRDEVATLDRFAAHRDQLIDPKVGEFGGRVVKTSGDGLLIEFASVVDAVQCAVDVQRAMAAREADIADSDRIRFRIGVNLGDVIVQGDDIHGDGVNVAARLQEIAAPGGIAVSGDVHRQVRNRIELDFEDTGDQQVKNIAEPVRVWQWRDPAADALAPMPEPLALPDKPSVAVLPFDNLSDDADQEFFADGIAEDIITALSRLRGFFVIARNSAFTYKGKTVNVTEVGRELGVAYVLEGSVRKAGNRVRITGQLIDAGTGNHLWAEKFDGDLTDIFALQDEITHKIVSSVGPELILAEADRLRATPPQNLDAWACTTRGFMNFWRWTKAELADSTRLAERAIELEPEGADGHALLSAVLWAQALSGFVKPGAKYMAEAAEAARRAVALDDRSARAHAAMAVTLLTYRQFDEAVAEVERAVELEPGSADVLSWSGVVHAYAGPQDLAIEQSREAIRLNPRDPGVYGRYQAMSGANFALGRYREALDAAGRVARMLPEWIEAHTFMIASLAELDRLDEAQAALAAVRRLQPRYSVTYATRRHPYRDPAITNRLAAALRKAGVE